MRNFCFSRTHIPGQPKEDSLFASSQSGQRGLRCLVEYFQKCLSRSRRAAFSLFPVAYRFERNIDTLRKFKLTQSQATAYATCKFCSVLHGFGIVLGYLRDDVFLTRGIQTILVHTTSWQ